MTRTNENATIVLKTIHNDIMNDNENATITTKQMRAKLRVEMNDVHVRNSSWIFTQSQYDVVRAMFDEKYAAKIERASKRAKTTRAKSTRKNDAKLNDADDNANVNDDTNNVNV